jgi:hypothetical protein
MSTTPTTPTPAGPPAPTRPRRRFERGAPPHARADERASGETARAASLARNGFVLAVAGALALAALTLLYPSTPSYDPWAWIQWGREIAHLDLNTRTGPSWKPLPVFFTTLFAPFGGAAPDLWLVVARAGGLLALLTTARLASRLTGGGGRGIGAGAAAVAGLLLSTYWLRNTMFGYSEGLLIALCLFGVERHLDGHRGQAFALGFGAALIRPEVWPFFGLYGLWLMWKEPRHRRLVVTLGIATPMLWFLPELWGSGQPLRAASRAQEVVGSSPALSQNPVLELLRRARALLMAPVKAGILLAIGFGVVELVRRRRVPLVLWVATVAAAWVGIVAVMTRDGFAGNERYLAVPVALGCVIGGVGWAWTAGALGDLGARTLPISARRATLVAGVALLAALVPFTTARLGQLSDDDKVLRFEGQLRDDLHTAVARAGGRDKLLACGKPYAGAYNIAMVSWMLDVPGQDLGYQPSLPGVVLRARSRPDVYPTPPVNGAWKRTVTHGLWSIYSACAAPGGGVR